MEKLKFLHLKLASSKDLQHDNCHSKTSVFQLILAKALLCAAASTRSFFCFTHFL